MKGYSRFFPIGNKNCRDGQGSGWMVGGGGLVLKFFTGGGQANFSEMGTGGMVGGTPIVNLELTSPLIMKFLNGLRWGVPP